MCPICSSSLPLLSHSLSQYLTSPRLNQRIHELVPFALVIIDDFYFVAMAIMPNKTDSPLIVDTNRMLPFAFASQCFQTIPGWRSQKLELRRRVKLQQLPQRNAFDRPKAFAVPIVKKLLGFRRAEALNHSSRVVRSALYVKRMEFL